MRTGSHLADDYKHTPRASDCERVAEYVDGHPGADECDIAWALELPLLQVHDITRGLEKKAILRRGNG